MCDLFFYVSVQLYYHVVTSLILYLSYRLCWINSYSIIQYNIEEQSFRKKAFKTEMAKIKSENSKCNSTNLYTKEMWSI